MGNNKRSFKDKLIANSEITHHGILQSLTSDYSQLEVIARE